MKNLIKVYVVLAVILVVANIIFCFKYFGGLENIGTQIQIERNRFPKWGIALTTPANYDITFISGNVYCEEKKVWEHIMENKGAWGEPTQSSYYNGTPIKVDVTYFSNYEDQFYRAKMNFPIEKMKDYVNRAYAQGEASLYSKPVQEYITSIKRLEYDVSTEPYNSLSYLVFGFLPKGKIVVWMRFGSVQKELGIFQADIVKNDQKLVKNIFSVESLNRNEYRTKYYQPNASPLEWDNYRIKYNWKPIFSSPNKNLRVFEMNIEYYNREQEILLPLSMSKDQNTQRAIPKELNFTWESGKNQKYIGRAYFNWKNANEIFKKTDGKFNLEFKIAPDNSSFKILLNNEALPTDSVEIFKTDKEFKDSYK